MPYFYDNHMYSVDPDLKDLQKNSGLPHATADLIELTLIDLPLQRESKKYQWCPYNH